MNRLTKATQTAYKQGRSPIDILPLVQNILKFNETQVLILIDLTKSIRFHQSVNLTGRPIPEGDTMEDDQTIINVPQSS